MKTCSIDGCGRKMNCRGWCTLHYRRFQITGDPVGMKRPKYAGVKCSVSACEHHAQSNFMCNKHAQRVRRYGNAEYVTSELKRRLMSRAAQPSLGRLKETTYPKMLGRHEHRVVAEAMLGRPLKKGEIVHHRDGNKHNNATENLQIMAQSEHIKEHRDLMNAAKRKARGY